MNLLSRRIAKLEITSRSSKKTANPYEQKQLDEIEDWIINDPMAAELLKKEHEYCISKGYPTLDKDTLDFYEQLEDPVHDEMQRETLAAFDKYLRARMAI